MKAAPGLHPQGVGRGCKGLKPKQSRTATLHLGYDNEQVSGIISTSVSLFRIQPQFLNLARQRVASHAQQGGGFDASATGVLQRLGDERAFKLSAQVVQNILITALQSQPDLLCQCVTP